ncbi:Translation-associated GTPase (fragment) [Photobacterium kishitanii]
MMPSYPGSNPGRPAIFRLIVATVNHAEVAELVDALDLGSSAVRCESSSLSFRTIILHLNCG